MEKKNKDSRDIFLAQKELASRWKLTQTTLKNLRDKGVLPYFRVPSSSKILYPLEAILNIEKNNIQLKEEKHELAESKREKPVISARKKKKWEI